ncbi:MAG TPA: Cys-tRNA(Pro) deacylase [Rectinemataceae bacterium]|nr:Cys-tRNA(Pro) deacylase [Rectinemataceae bacterium]
MAAKTNALRILESHGVAHRVVSYDADESDLSARGAAAKAGIEAGRIFKTLAARGDRTGVFLCCVPGDAELDLKKAAKASGNKSVEMLSLKELQPTTGYLRGGCSPIGTKKPFPVLIDERALLFDEISVSAGARGLQVLLAPGDLLDTLASEAGGREAAFADVAKTGEP